MSAISDLTTASSAMHYRSRLPRKVPTSMPRLLSESRLIRNGTPPNSQFKTPLTTHFRTALRTIDGNKNGDKYCVSNLKSDEEGKLRIPVTHWRY